MYRQGASVKHLRQTRFGARSSRANQMNFDRSLKKGNFDRWIKRWRTDVPTANNCLCIMVMAYLISKTEIFFIYSG
jgi:hypothetical protein